jgi:nucleoside-diphosphate-sugar epimerase
MRLDLLINDFTYKAVMEGYLVLYEKHFKRTFIHVRDMARAILFALDNQDKMKDKVYNVGSDKMNYSKKEICDILVKKTNLKPHYAEVGEDQDKRNYEVSYKKINNLGFDTTISVEEGIDELVVAYQAIKLHNPYSNV